MNPFEILGYVFLAVYVLWVYYLASMSLLRARADGKVKPGTFQAFAVLFVVAPGLLLDWLVNVTICTALFAEIPETWRELVTGRLQRHCGQPTWRGRIASFICRQLLDRFDPTGKHC